MPPPHDKQKHDHDHKHKHDHDKLKHDHDHKHKHDHDHYTEEEAPSSDTNAAESSETSAPTKEAEPSSYSSSTQEAVQTYTSTGTSSSSSSKVKLPIKTTQLYGGEGGGPFDDGFHKKIIEIGIQAGAVIDSVSMLYFGGQKVKHGGDSGSDATFTLREDEYVVEVTVNATAKMVCGLTFVTNLGRTFGPHGGKGAVLISGLKSPEEFVVKAPGDGYCLKGIKGRSGKYLDAIGFHWGAHA